MMIWFSESATSDLRTGDLMLEYIPYDELTFESSRDCSMRWWLSLELGDFVCTRIKLVFSVLFLPKVAEICFVASLMNMGWFLLGFWLLSH